MEKRDDHLTPEEKNISRTQRNTHKAPTSRFMHGNMIDKGHFWIRKSLESWHTAITQNADNNSKPLHYI